MRGTRAPGRVPLWRGSCSSSSPRRGCRGGRAHGVEKDVARGFGELRVAVDHDGGESAEEDVSSLGMPPVEPLRVATVQPLHPNGERRLGRRDEEVVVVSHQAVSPYQPLVPRARLRQQLDEASVFAAVGVKRLTANAAIHQVVRPTGSLGPQRARHRQTVRGKSRGSSGTAPFVTQES